MASPDECPGCGDRLAPLPPRPIIEKPFAQCARCGGFVPRAGANEWDLYRPGVRLDFVARSAFRAIGVGLVFALLWLLVALLAGRGWDVPWAMLALAAGALAAGAWEGTRLGKAIRRSKRRMGDPMYLAKLVEYELAAGGRR